MYLAILFRTNPKHCLPEPRAMKGKDKGTLHGKGLKYVKISNYCWKIILEAIKENEKIGGCHINPHSFIVGYCSANALDLYGTGLLDT